MKTSQPKNRTYTPYCPHCRSKELTFNASIEWNHRAQKFDIVEVTKEDVYCRSGLTESKNAKWLED